MEIQIWAQMFFEDGSVSQGMRIPAEWLDEHNAYAIAGVAEKLLKGLNRDEGWLLLWGAGNMEFNHYPSAFCQDVNAFNYKPISSCQDAVGSDSSDEEP